MSLFNLLAPHSEGAVPIDKGFNLLSLFRSIIPNSYNIVKSFLALFALFYVPGDNSPLYIVTAYRIPACPIDFFVQL